HSRRIFQHTQHPSRSGATCPTPDGSNNSQVQPSPLGSLLLSKYLSEDPQLFPAFFHPHPFPTLFNPRNVSLALGAFLVAMGVALWRCSASLTNGLVNDDESFNYARSYDLLRCGSNYHHSNSLNSDSES
ncbi:unnamed protein product, partial [Nesidiocoris tenuis]